MSCPAEIAAILLEILRTAVLRIRAAGWSEDPARCADEADHIHNLPDLLRNYSPERLRYYWEVERAGFLSQSPGADVAPFEPLWGQLARYAATPAGPVRAPEGARSS
jgi:hypothetical protein